MYDEANAEKKMCKRWWKERRGFLLPK